jgi:hypothetical protein
MATNLAVSTNFGSLSTYVYPGGYDQTKLGLGPCMMQANDDGNEGKWVGPIPNNLFRPYETATLGVVQPDAVTWSSTYDWVICADGAAASLTRKFFLYTFNKTVRVNPWGYAGYITCASPPGTGTNTNRGHKVSYEKYTTGTVTVTNGSTTVTGDGTTWADSRIFAGSRIGFTSADPSAIITWYGISSITNNTTIVLTSNYLGENASSQPYVIEDLRILFALTNSTAANSGLFMAAGLRYEQFTGGGTSIAVATTVDKLNRVYWLSDGNAANNATIQSYGGVAIDARTDWTHQNVYCGDFAAGQSRFQLNNFRAAMTVGGTTSGRDSVASTWTLNTGQQAVSGTVSQLNNLVLCTPSSGGGPRSEVKSLFWITTTKIYSAAAANITSGNTTFQSGVTGSENPPGGTATFPATSVLNTITYDSVSDRFLVLTTGATAFRSYWTLYREDAGQWERVILTDTRLTNQSTEDATAAIYPNTLSLNTTACCLGGMTYLVTHGLSSITNFIYNVPFGADWEYASTSNCCVVTPAMNSSQFMSFVAAYINTIDVVGGPSNPTLGRTGTNLGADVGATRLYYRTTGISDNSGVWNLLDYSGAMSASAAASVQARIEFRIINNCIPSRVTRVCFEGTGALDDHFQFSQGKSSVADKQFAFRYSTAFGTTVPTLYIRLYNGVTNELLVSDDSVTKTGTWEKSTNGTDWAAFDTADRANETTYLRYTPTSLADDINVLPVLALS